MSYNQTFHGLAPLSLQSIKLKGYSIDLIGIFTETSVTINVIKTKPVREATLKPLFYNVTD